MPETQNPLFQYNYKKISENASVNAKKIIEACYHLEAAKGLLELARKSFADENIDFLINCNHLFLLKAGLKSRLKEILTIEYNGKMKDGLKAIFDRHITVNSDKEINLSYTMRKNLKKTELAICASHDLLALDKAREECAGLIYDTIKLTIKDIKVMPSLKKVMDTQGTPINNEVLRRLNLQATNANNFLSSVPTRSRRL